MHIRKTIHINSTREKLWTWLTEFERLKDWNKDVLKEELISEGRVGRGFKTKMLIREGRKEVWYDNEILIYEPEHHLSTSLAGTSLGKNEMIVDYELTESDNGVSLSYQSRWQPAGLFLKMLHPIIKVVANKNADNCLKRLKSGIEESSSGPDDSL